MSSDFKMTSKEEQYIGKNPFLINKHITVIKMESIIKESRIPGFI
jgi:hypothetical protein